jgi:putative SOS response-associated peptidase YedK
MFRSSYSGRHCLVITDGFYEWKNVAGKTTRTCNTAISSQQATSVIA